MLLTYCPHCGKMTWRDDSGKGVEPTESDMLKSLMSGECAFVYCQGCESLSAANRKSVFDQALINYYNAARSITGTVEEYEHEPLVNALAFLSACILKSIKKG